MAITLDGTNGVTTPDLTVDTTTITVDPSNNRVGIGTASPNNPLEIAHTGSVGAGGLRIGDPSTIASDTGIYLRTTGDAVIGAAGGNIVFDTNMAVQEDMRIDSSGRVTTPRQPRFFSYMNGRFPSGSGDISGGSIMVFDQTNQNVGNGFNTSNYRYTAPVAGTYVFGMNVRLVNNNGIRVARAVIRKNGSQQWGLAFVGGSKSPNASDHPSLNGVTIIAASANDYFDLEISSELSYAGHLYADPGLRSNFWGYLLA